MLKSALLVIDVQDSFYEAPYWQAEQFEPFQQKMLRLIDKCQTQKVPVVKILHSEPESHGSSFHPDSGLVKSMDFLPECFDAEFTKHVHNAFTDTELGDWLKKNGIERLIISGIRTEQCCETTTRIGFDLGYEMDYVIDATLTFDMQDHLGNIVTADEIKAKTRLVLEHRFARVGTLDELKL